MAESYDQLSLLSNLMDDALKQGADAADAVVFNASSVSVSCRLGKLEKLERSESNDLGLRVFVGRQQAIVSSTDFEEGAIKDVVARAVAMAKAAPEDPYCGIATADSLVTDPPTLQIYDAKEPRDESLIEAACSAEDAARIAKDAQGIDWAWFTSEKRM